MVTGYYTALVQEDLPPLRSDDIPADIDVDFAKHWEEELQNENPSLFAALRRNFGLRFAIGGLIKLGNDGAISYRITPRGRGKMRREGRDLWSLEALLQKSFSFLTYNSIHFWRSSISTSHCRVY